MSDLQTQQDLTLGLYDEHGDIVIYAKQYDTQRYIKFEFTENILPEDLTSIRAFIRGRYSDNSLIPIALINKDDDEITSDYILFHIPSSLLSVAGRTICDLVICDISNIADINEDGTINSDDTKILSTHSFTIHVAPLPTAGGKLTEHQKDEIEGLTEIVLEVQALEKNVQIAETARSDAEIIRNLEENGGTETLSDGTEYTVDYADSRKYQELVRQAYEDSGYVEDPDGNILADVDVDDSRTGAEDIRKANEKIRIQNEEKREETETGYIALAESYAIGNETAREGSDEDNAKYYSELSESYAIGNTGMREDENEDNAQYYCEKAKEIVTSKGYMDMYINDDGHLIYERTDSFVGMDFSIEDHSNLILVME